VKDSPEDRNRMVCAMRPRDEGAVPGVEPWRGRSEPAAPLCRGLALYACTPVLLAARTSTSGNVTDRQCWLLKVKPF